MEDSELAGNDPNVHGLGDVHEAQGVGHEAPKIDARIHDRGAAANRVTGGGGTPQAREDDLLRLTEGHVDEEAPVNQAMLQAVAFRGQIAAAGTGDNARSQLMARLRQLDARIDERERALHDAIAVGDTKAAEGHADALTAVFKERARATDELEMLDADPPLDSQDDWIELEDEPAAAPPAPSDARLAAFIEATLVAAESPAAGSDVPACLIHAGLEHAVDPLLLLAIAEHETAYGRVGDRLFGVGRPHPAYASQIQEAARVFALLRERGTSTAEARPEEQARAVKQAGWTQEEAWEDLVTAAHERLLSAWKQAGT